jgi:hypothetical protein
VSVVHKHRFADVTDANAFVCGVNWVKNLLQEGNLGSVDDLEVQDILVGEEFGSLVATVVVLEVDDDYLDPNQPDEDHDHREHV